MYSTNIVNILCITKYYINMHIKKQKDLFLQHLTVENEDRYINN